MTAIAALTILVVAFIGFIAGVSTGFYLTSRPADNSAQAVDKRAQLYMVGKVRRAQ